MVKIYSFSGVVQKWSINHLIRSLASFDACRLPLLEVKSLPTALDKKHLLVSASWDLTRLSMLQTFGLLPARLLKVLLYDSNWVLVWLCTFCLYNETMILQYSHRLQCNESDFYPQSLVFHVRMLSHESF